MPTPALAPIVAAAVHNVLGTQFGLVAEPLRSAELKIAQVFCLMFVCV
jgi:hypothetical protein